VPPIRDNTETRRSKNVNYITSAIGRKNLVNFGSLIFIL